MSEESKDEQITALKFANDFLRITRSVQVASNKPDPLPDEILQHLANDQIDQLMKKAKADPEMLLWGVVNILEIVMRYAELDAEELAEMIDKFIEWRKEKE